MHTKGTESIARVLIYSIGLSIFPPYFATTLAANKITVIFANSPG